MLRPSLLFGSVRRAVFGSAGAQLWGCRSVWKRMSFPQRISWWIQSSGFLNGLQSIKGSCFNFSTAVYKEVTYKELKNLLKSKTITLIDVRETWEILEYGKIPGSINIPLDEVGKALQMNPRDFKDKYNEVKPSESDNLVFSCLAGVRSKKALDTAISLGFNRAQHYAGGWKEWTTYEFSNKQGS